MPNTIDTLNIEIKANANSAANGIDKLTRSLMGLNNVANAGGTAAGLSALSSSVSRLGSSMQAFSGMTKARDFTRVATGLKKIVSVDTSNLRNTAQDLAQLSSGMSSLGTIAFDSTGLANMANSLAKFGRGGITQSVQNIPQIRDELLQLTQALQGVSFGNFDFSQLEQFTSSISRLGGKNASSAAGNITAIGAALAELMTTLSKAPQVNANVTQLITSIGNLAQSGQKAGTASKAMSSSLNRFSASAKASKGHARSLASAIGKLYAEFFLLVRAAKAIGKAIDVSSQLTEVQNVVTQTFGQYSYLMDEFTGDSITKFGMSELTAKKIASKYQAMGTAMGFTQKQAADMSLTMTGLAADMASFYNVEQDVVAEDLQAIFTGQTRPLRQYGIDLTQASLQEYAMKQGIDANIASMSRMEKTLLSYNYVLNATKYAQGDFERTSDTWANQVRILKNQFQALGAIIGTGMINALKPFIRAMNAALSSVLVFARNVLNALGAIFGWTYEVTGGGVAQDMEDAVGYADDLSDGIGGAADNAEKLKKTLSVLSFDELNQLSDAADNASSGSGGSGGSGGGGSSVANTTGEFKRVESIYEKYMSEIDNLEQLGGYISEKISNSLLSINWNEVYESARGFGKGLADFLNGLITPKLFGAVGKTIAGALNTAINAAFAFGDTFDFYNLGESIAEGINQFFDEFDFNLFGRTIAKWLNGIKDTIVGFVKKLDWSDIFVAIKDFLSGLFSEVDATTWLLIGGIFSAKKLIGLITGSLVTASADSGIIGAATALGGVIAKAMGNPVTKWLAAIAGGTALNYYLNEKRWEDNLKTGGNSKYGAQSFNENDYSQILTGLTQDQAIEKVQDIINKGLSLQLSTDVYGLDASQQAQYMFDLEQYRGSLDEYLKMYNLTIDKWGKVVAKTVDDNGKTDNSDTKKKGVLSIAVSTMMDKASANNVRKELDKKLGKTMNNVFTETDHGTFTSTQNFLTSHLGRTESKVTTYTDMTSVRNTKNGIAIGVSGVLAAVGSRADSGQLTATKNAIASGTSGVVSTVGVKQNANNVVSTKNAITSGVNGVSTTVGVKENAQQKSAVKQSMLNTFGTIPGTVNVGTNAANLQAVHNNVQAYLNGFTMKIDKTGVYHNGGYTYFAEGGIYKNGKWKDIPRAATGGLFNRGQMFIAREAGPELVGTLPGGGTAVLNNNQIVASVSSGVAQAVSSVLSAMRFPDTQISFAMPNMDMGVSNIGNGIKISTDAIEELSDAIATKMADVYMMAQTNANITVNAELRTESDEVLARAVARGTEKLAYAMG